MTRTAGAETLALFARFVRRNIGVHFTPERLPELAQKMGNLAKGAGHADLEGYLLRLMSEPLTRDRLDLLIRTLTIGETYFLRDPKSYQVLTDHLLPELLESRRETGKSIRIWSAGCSTGEEPYSIAILLRRALADLDDWNVTLLATDINRESLERGRRGLYRGWSFRNAPPWLMDYFTSRAGGCYEIDPAIRKMVRFQEFNLADQGSCDSVGVNEMDIIFCRNVMLYFDQRQIERTMARLHAALRAGGRLFVGPSEFNHTVSDGFALEYHDGSMVLRKEAEEKKPGLSPWRVADREAAQPTGGYHPPSAPNHPLAGAPVLKEGDSDNAQPQKISPAPLFQRREDGASAANDGGGSPVASQAREQRSGYAEAVALYQAGRYLEAAETALLAVTLAGEEAEALALSARAYANVGKLQQARECCERAIASDRLNAHNHYLLSIILEQQGDPAALQSLKNALFVDHDYLPAYVALGNLNRQSGDRKEAERNFANALRLLEKRHPHEILAEAEGMTAGRLAEIIRDGMKA